MCEIAILELDWYLHETYVSLIIIGHYILLCYAVEYIRLHFGWLFFVPVIFFIVRAEGGEVIWSNCEIALG